MAGFHITSTTLLLHCLYCFWSVGFRESLLYRLPDISTDQPYTRLGKFPALAITERQYRVFVIGRESTVFHFSYFRDIPVALLPILLCLHVYEIKILCREFGTLNQVFWKKMTSTSSLRLPTLPCTLVTLSLLLLLVHLLMDHFSEVRKNLVFSLGSFFIVEHSKSSLFVSAVDLVLFT